MKQPKSGVTRRKFLQDSATGLGTALVAGSQLAASATEKNSFAPPQALGASDRIRIGVIGPGGRARSLMSTLKRLTGNEIIAVCDVYEPNLLQAATLAAPGAKQYHDYHELLASKEIDAVVIGSPDHWHKQMMIDAVRAGKDVYLEKPISHSIEEGAEMVRVVETSKQVVQTGTQQRSWEHYRTGKEIIDSGKLGEINFVYTFWYQNYTGRRDFKNFAPDKLDWKRWLGSARQQPLTPEKFHLWRWYWDFGGGALTDLMTHWIDVIQWYMNTPAPTQVTTSGSLHQMKWDCPDTISCFLDYPKNYSVNYTGAMMSRIDDGGIEFRGTKGTLKIDRSHLAVYMEQDKNASGTLLPEPETLIRSKQDGTIAHMQNFLDCVRSRQTPTANIRVAHEAARASHLGNLAFKRQRTVKWNEARQKIEV